ncbi:MAG: hypothetical protein RMJ37_01775 [Spirochaetia bacterium]|nr:hypothetical protein [Spirochaetota bacterium]MCX8096605.1 hypothetical protein [Spirochaetota bacterium]MDW8112052.1 hypothetical protein [Spirochaetia bacterium]
MVNRYLFSLGTIDVFNKSLRHFYKTSGVMNAIKSGQNPADMINEYLDNGDIEPLQIIPISYALLVQKFNYKYVSYNLSNSVDNFNTIVKKISTWDKVDIVIIYHNPTVGCLAINPKSLRHFNKVGFLGKNQLVVVYAKCISDKEDKKEEIESKALSLVIDLLDGKDIGDMDSVLKSKDVKKSEVKKESSEEVSDESFQITPKYGVEVTNELFHNGNVEAWKNIIESYNVKYPHLKVMVFHGGEQINDLNALFKWGKVKHGDTIFFCVAGRGIRDISKLRKYLFEGASNRFHTFLKKDVNKPLELF